LNHSCISWHFLEYKRRPEERFSILAILAGALVLRQEEALEAAGDIVQRPAHAECAESAARLAAESGWREARQRVEARAEGAEALVADVQADFGDAVVAGQQQLLGLLDAPAGNEFVRCLVEGLGEQTIEIKRRKTGLTGGVG
jgi:hypothetical protein